MAERPAPRPRCRPAPSARRLSRPPRPRATPGAASTAAAWTPRMRAQRPVQPEQRRAHHRGAPRERRTVAPGAAARIPSTTRRSNVASRDGNTPPARTTVGAQTRQVEPADDRPGHRDQLVGLPVDDRASDCVPGRGRREDDRRQLGEPAVRQGPGLDPAGDVDRPRQAEVRRHERLQRRSAARVRRVPGRPRRGRRPDVVPAAPVARDVAERGQPCRPPVGCDPGGIDALSRR